jgi:predicted enzyme related to lactoylglutathione lyase
MTTMTSPPNGAPYWTDLCTSDVQRSPRFYGAQFELRANDG